MTFMRRAQNNRCLPSMFVLCLSWSACMSLCCTIFNLFLCAWFYKTSDQDPPLMFSSINLLLHGIPTCWNHPLHIRAESSPSAFQFGSLRSDMLKQVLRLSKSHFWRCQNHTFESVKITLLKVSKSHFSKWKMWFWHFSKWKMWFWHFQKCDFDNFHLKIGDELTTSSTLQIAKLATTSMCNGSCACM